jgi:predicted DCC family thiol-disulfide oxidoreductase YuxK
MYSEQNISTVLFDGSCSICSAEINQYKLITPTDQIYWVDVSAPDFIVPAGKTREELMQRFHVIKPSGEYISGASAFVHVWEKLPGWRKLAAVAKLPGALQAMEFGYTNFLRIRPRVQSFFKKRFT